MAYSKSSNTTEFLVKSMKALESEPMKFASSPIPMIRGLSFFAQYTLSGSKVVIIAIA